MNERERLQNTSITKLVHEVFDATGSGNNKTRTANFMFKLYCTDGEHFSASFRYYGGYHFGRGDTAEEAVLAARDKAVTNVEAYPWGEESPQEEEDEQA